MEQREHMSDLRIKLQRRLPLSNRENDIIIKYVKSVPKIINVSKNSLNRYSLTFIIKTRVPGNIENK